MKRINIHFVFVLLAAFLWGTAGIFVRTAKNFQLGEMQLVFGRAIITAIILAVIMLLKDLTLFKIALKDIWIFALAGLASIVLFNFSYYKTMSLTSLSVAAVLLYTAPFFVLFISTFLFKESLTTNKILACFVAFLGCLFVSGIFSSSEKISGMALFFGLLTGFGYALYTVFSEILIKKGYETLTITFYVFLFAAIFTIPFINVKHTVRYAFSQPKGLLIVALMALFNTVLPYILYTTGLRGVETSTAPIIATLEPVVATIIGATFFGEGYSLTGILLVLSSIVILNLKTVTVKANAKINLALAVCNKRDDGYHLIKTVMQSVTLFDTVRVDMSDKINVSCSNKTLFGENNIAFKAAQLFFKETKLSGGAEIHIKKKIPQAAGLGGGSADAAAVLVALDRLYKTNLSKNKLCEIAVKLGADVPFFIEGGTVKVEGIGEKLTKLTPVHSLYIVLAKQDNKPSTAEMYQRLDNENFVLPDIEKLVEQIENKKEIYSFIDNSFKKCWQNNPLETKLLSFNPLAVSLSGSGPTFFACFEDKAAAKKAFKQLKKENISCWLVRDAKKALIIE